INFGGRYVGTVTYFVQVVQCFCVIATCSYNGFCIDKQYLGIADPIRLPIATLQVVLLPIGLWYKGFTTLLQIIVVKITAIVVYFLSSARSFENVVMTDNGKHFAWISRIKCCCQIARWVISSPA